MTDNRKAPKKLTRGNTVPPKVLLHGKQTTVPTNTEQAGRTAPPKVPVNKKKS